ncbi:hypothetical protein ACFQ67_04120 [Streptomyces sp. NPDC056488]|uniref:hypothetical protein n=1 Tax=unclassified Streptomyces TaxID=2593676 RepID=UPI00368053D6
MSATPRTPRGPAREGAARAVTPGGAPSPRGLASIVLGLLVLEEHVPGAGLLGRAVAVTVGLSVLPHGVSAVVLADRYGRWIERTTARGTELREGTPVPEAAHRRVTPR